MNGLGWRHDRAGNAEKALHWYGRALDTAPRYARARLNRAGLHLRAGRLDEAERDAREAVAAAPNAPQTRHALGEVLAARGDTEGARAAFGDALALSPDFAPSRAALDALPPAPAM
ncbi:MAG: tetratricopeptide repeat protein [Candidatus Hydrogenedentes bacterium]|nr:tetratricopeptide repeat protein [Candidatus Hydrogenedentota bacterium]